MDMKHKHTIRITDHVSGEVVDFGYSNMRDAETVYLQVKAMLDIYKRAEIKLKEFIGKEIDDKYDFGDGYTGQWIPKSTRHYDIQTVRKYLDEDQLSDVMDINPRKLKDLFSQLVEDGKGIPGAWPDIEANAEIKVGKPYFVIKKAG